MSKYLKEYLLEIPQEDFILILKERVQVKNIYHRISLLGLTNIIYGYVWKYCATIRLPIEFFKGGYNVLCLMHEEDERLKLVTFSHPGFTVFFIPIIALAFFATMQSLITTGNLNLLFLTLKQRFFYFHCMILGGGIYALNFCLLRWCKIDEKYYQKIEDILLKDVKWEQTM